MRPRSAGTIVTATVVLTAARVAVLGLSFLQVLILARQYGAGPETDAYFLASSFFFFLVTGMEGTLSATFVPTFIQQREQDGEDTAWNLARSLFQVLLLGSLALAVPFFAAAPLIALLLAPGSPAEVHALCGRIMRIQSPLIVLLPLNGLVMSLYYSYRRFTSSALLSTLPLAGSILSLLLLSDRMGVAALPAGMVAFSAVQFLCLAVGLGPQAGRLFAFSRRHPPSLKTVLRLAPPRFLGFSLMRLDLMIDRAFASSLGAGVVTAIAYAGKVPSLAASLISSPLLKSMIPFVATLTAQGETRRLARILSSAIRGLGVVLIPLTLLVVLFANDIVAVLFERGAFTLQAREMTAYALSFYAFGLLFYGVNPLLRGVFFAFQDTMTPLKVGAVSSALNVVLNIVLVRVLSHGGIALATSLAAAFSAVTLLVLAKGRVPTLRLAEVFRGLLRPLAAGLAAVIVLRLGMVPLAGSWHRDGIVSLAAHFLAGAILYAGFCVLFRVNLRVWEQDPDVV